MNMRFKIPIDSGQTSRQYPLNPSYTWRGDWNSSWQSPWGYVQRFRFANALTYAETYTALGPLGTRTPSRRWGFNSFRQVNELQWAEIFDITIEEHQQKFVDTHLKILVSHKNLTFDQFISKQLRFCLKCLQDGYHSYFHQLHGLNQCVFHKTPLLEECPQCRRHFMYGVTSTEFARPFGCDCGFKFLDTSDNETWRLERWVAHRNLVINHSVYPKPLSIESSAVESGNYLGVYPTQSELKVSLQDMVEAERGATSKTAVTFGWRERAMGSTKSISKITVDTGINNTSTLSTPDIYRIFKCIARHIRKTNKRLRLSKYVRELQEFADGTTESLHFNESAYAYLQWRAEIEDRMAPWYVDRSPLEQGNKRFRNDSRFLRIPDDESVEQFVSQLVGFTGFGQTTDGSEHNWLMSHIITKNFLHSYQEWLMDGHRLAGQGSREQLQRLKYRPQALRQAFSPDTLLRCEKTRALITISHKHKPTIRFF